MVDGYDITLMAVTAAHIATDLNLTMDKIGFVFSAALGGMVLGSLTLSNLSDVFGRRRVVLISLSLLAISVLLTSFIHSYAQLLTLRFLSGIAGGALLVCQATLVSEYSTVKFKALSVCIVTAGYPLGAMFTGIIASQVIEPHGWRMMFIIGGVFSVLLFLLAYRYLLESYEFVAHKKTLVNKPKSRLNLQKNSITSLLSKENKKTSIMLWSVFFLSFTTLYFLMSWMPKLLNIAGFDALIGQQAFSYFNLGGVFGTLLLGLIAINKILIKVINAFFITATLIMFVFAYYAVDSLSINLISFFLGLFIQGGFVGLYALASQSYSVQYRATGVGWAIGLGRMGAVFGPIIAGYLVIAGIGISASFQLFALPLLAVVLILYLRKSA